LNLGTPHDRPSPWRTKALDTFYDVARAKMNIGHPTANRLPRRMVSDPPVDVSVQLANSGVQLRRATSTIGTSTAYERLT
jgi:hypothetical protein